MWLVSRHGLEPIAVKLTSVLWVAPHKEGSVIGLETGATPAGVASSENAHVVVKAILEHQAAFLQQFASQKIESPAEVDSPQNILPFMRPQEEDAPSA
jgi:hypothetical protein